MRLLRASTTFLRSYSSTASAKKTCLHDVHVKHGGKMVTFAGYDMPVQYSDLSIKDSTIHTRKHVSIFDVSHMLQTEISGKDQIAFLESLTTADVEGMKENTGALSVFTNEKGGIRDDLILSKTDKGFVYMVTNAGCIDKDLPYLQENAEKWRSNGKDVNIKVLDGRGKQYNIQEAMKHLIENLGLIAVQGPEMVQLLQNETDIDLSKLYFMQSAIGTVYGVPNCRVTRCGYTGEDGVEISIDENQAANVIEKMLQSKNANAKLAGLGARDALRVEAGLCLYGSDINENTTPIEAAIAFVVAKRRRQTLGFPGAEKIVEQLEKKNYAKRRVGFIAEPGRAPREHLPILDPMDKASVGFITSGCPSPCLGKNVAIGYVDKIDAKIGKQLLVDFGKKTLGVTVSKMPFVPSKYYTK